MLSFIKKVLVFSLLIVTAFLLVKVYTIQYLPQNFYSVYSNKLKMLSAIKAQRKIVLIGGSSVGFGISAKQIEQATGIKTINMGQGAGLGLLDARDYILNNITKNDIIIFSPEWAFYEKPSFTDAAVLDNFIHNNPEYGVIINRPTYVMQSAFSAIYSYEFNNAGKKDKMSEDLPPYVYNCINESGDIISHCGLKRIGPKPYLINLKKFDLKKFLEAFSFVGNHNTLIVFPPTQQPLFKKYGADLRRVENTLRTHKLNVVNNVTDNVYPDSSFFDAEYHLTCENRTIRTKIVINSIKKLLKY